MSAARALKDEAVATLDVELAGLHARLDASGALLLVAERVLVVADLHLEKGSSLARRGSLLPPYDTLQTLANLGDAIRRHDPRRVVLLGDSFHDRRGPDRLGEADREALADLLVGRDWTWVLGNHDPVLPPALGGEVVAEVTVGPLTLRHHPQPGRRDEVAGHLHPVAKVVTAGRGVRNRAFLTDGRRCVLPAFGAYAGGLNACDAAFAPLFPAGFTAHVVGRTRLFSIARRQLCGD